MLSRSSLAALAGVLASAALLGAVAPAQARVPREFFGVVPQTEMTPADAARMRAGGVDVVRIGIFWGAVDSTARGEYDWRGVDDVVATAARAHMRVLPFVYATPRWLAGRPTVLPVSSARQRRAWTSFLQAAVARYGSRGSFWQEHSEGADYVPRMPVRAWQLWNEPNFFYFATPASPTRYARLLKISRQAVRGTDPRAEIVLGGLFGNPGERPPRAMDAADFLDRLYRVPGIRRTFDAVALHPYARDAEVLRGLTEGLRRVIVRHRDRRTRLYLTEVGWGSQYDPHVVAFEVGRGGQARELRRSYRYLIANRRRLNLRQVDWFTWKDVRGSCNFCDSSGLFRAGARFRPKPAWHAFTAIAR